MPDTGIDKRYVFCDFDGTITATESLEAVFKHFLPGKWEPVKEQLRSGKTTLREGVPKLIESIPSARYPEVLQFVSEIPIRPGFEAFLTFLEDRRIPLVIVSGGIRGMVEAKVGHLKDRIHDIIAVDVDTSGEFLKVDCRYAGGTELVAKSDVLRAFDADCRIVIGDGITDFNMARNADLVFARSALARYLTENGIHYRKWGDFTDIRLQLRDWLTGR